jgi:hypothetical protein
MVLMAISKIFREIGEFTTTNYAQFIVQMVKDSFEVICLERKFELFSLHYKKT